MRERVERERELLQEGNEERRRKKKEKDRAAVQLCQNGVVSVRPNDRASASHGRHAV